MTDLETRIRDALRSDEIGYYDLRQPELRTARTNSRRRVWLPALAAAALVAALAAVLAGTNLSRNSAPPATGTAPFVGYSWRLVGLHDKHGTLKPPDSVDASIEFGPDGKVFGSTTGGAVWGTYRLTGDGYVVTDAGLSAQQAADLGPLANRVLGGLGAVFFHIVGRHADPTQPATVQARVDGDALLLQVPGVSLTLAQDGHAAVSPVLAAVGYAWRLTKVRDSHGTLAVPATLHPIIAFTRDGYVLAKDGVNTWQGSLVPAPEGYVVNHRAGSAAGYAGTDPTRVRVINAIGEALPAAHSDPVSASVSADTLVLTHNGTTLMLQRGPEMPFAGIVSGAHGSATASAVVAPPGPNSSPVAAPTAS